MIFLYAVHSLEKAEEYCYLLSADEEVDMAKKELLKLLAGLSLASLIAGAGLSVTGCATTG